MRKLLLQSALVAAVVLGALGFAVQRSDVTALVDEQVTLAPKTATINSAYTGVWVDNAGYSGAMLYMQTGVVDNVATISYLVLQDSSAGLAVALVDSVLVDSVDNKAYEIGYKGSRRFLRAVQRATAAATDSLWQSASIILSGKRSR